MSTCRPSWLWLCLLVAGCALESTPESSPEPTPPTRVQPEEAWPRVPRKQDAAVADGAVPSDQASAAKAAGDKPGPDASNALDAGSADPLPPSKPEPSPDASAPEQPKSAGAPANMPAPSDAGAAVGGADAAGSADAAVDAGDKSLVQTLIEAVLDMYAQRGQKGDDAVSGWRDKSSGKGLSAAFVSDVLGTMKNTGFCFAEARTCAQLCFTIAQDCKPCVKDPACKAALTDVCGELAGRCLAR